MCVREGPRVESGEFLLIEAAVDYTIEYEKEVDGRWLAEVPQLPGVLAYGATSDEAMRNAEALALRVLADRLEQNETKAVAIRIGLKAA